MLEPMSEETLLEIESCIGQWEESPLCEDILGLIADWRRLKAKEKTALEVPDEPTVARIMWSWLKSHGYTALCGDECGCEIGDLFPCRGEFAILNCKPGYWRKATDEQCRDMDMPLGSFSAFLDKEPES